VAVLVADRGGGRRARGRGAQLAAVVVRWPALRAVVAALKLGRGGGAGRRARRGRRARCGGGGADLTLGTGIPSSPRWRWRSPSSSCSLWWLYGRAGRPANLGGAELAVVART
jgi:hypothetical protein